MMLGSVGRRELLVGATAMAGFGSAQAATIAVEASAPPVTIPLWPEMPPGGGGPRGPEQVSEGGAVYNISQPRLVMRRPAKPNGSAVLILGGGGYRRIGIAKESQPTADWLEAYGVTTFILFYRLPGEGWPMRAPFQDAQRAMRIIRAKAEGLGLDGSQIGIIGYSAGGHCAGITCVRPDAELYAPVDAADQQSARPDFAGLIYPVLTMMPPDRTRVSTLTLLGSHPTLDMSAEWSVEQHVTDDTPTTFLAHATDDPIAPVENSLLMFAALRRVHVPVEMHVFRSGGHGFNLGQPGAEDHAWPRLFATWAGFSKT
jgi:acetyl esterase/lipase